MHQRWPWAFRFNGSKNRLMVRRGLACSDGRIFNLNVVFARDFAQLVKQSGGLSRILQHGLMLPKPPVAFCPCVALLRVKSWLRQLTSTGRHLSLCATDSA